LTLLPRFEGGCCNGAKCKIEEEAASRSILGASALMTGLLQITDNEGVEKLAMNAVLFPAKVLVQSLGFLNDPEQ
jgi:hypothetical protein